MKVLIPLIMTLIAAGVMAVVLVRFFRRLRKIEEELWGPPKKK
jgi:hypothetical protein